MLDNKDGFYNDSESDDSDNDDEIYNENNEQQQLSEGFANNCYKTVSPILLQDLIKTLQSASTVVVHFYLLKTLPVATVLDRQPPFPTCYYSPLTPQVGSREKQTREEQTKL